MKRYALPLAGLFASFTLVACGGQDLDEESVKEACHDQRIEMMADDADPNDLGSDWPRNWKYSPPDSDGWASGSWVEGDPDVMEVAYGCAVSEDGNIHIEKAT